MSETRERVHELIERLPAAKLSAVAGLLEGMLDTSSDDEPITDEDRRCVREGRAWFAQRGGKGIPMEEVLSDFGLKAEDFPLGK